MAELEKANATPKKKLASKIITKLDNVPADVVQWCKEGRELYFGDGDEFLELPTEAYKGLSLDSKRRYDIAKSHTEGKDVVGDATPEAFNLPFNVRPDAAGRQLAVQGADKAYDYHWSRPDKYGQHVAEGWVVDHDPSVSTEYREACSYKTVGGQNNPELILLKRPKTLSEQKRKERKALRDGQVQKAQVQFHETGEKLGIKTVGDGS